MRRLSVFIFCVLLFAYSCEQKKAEDEIPGIENHVKDEDLSEEQSEIVKRIQEKLSQITAKDFSIIDEIKWNSGEIAYCGSFDVEAKFYRNEENFPEKIELNRVEERGVQQYVFYFSEERLMFIHQKMVNPMTRESKEYKIFVDRDQAVVVLEIEGMNETLADRQKGDWAIGLGLSLKDVKTDKDLVQVICPD